MAQTAICALKVAFNSDEHTDSSSTTTVSFGLFEKNYPILIPCFDFPAHEGFRV